GQQHSYRMRPQMRVEGIPHLAGADLSLKINVRHLPQRMDACIRPARPCRLHRRAVERLRRGFEDLLHRRDALLSLPAGEGAAIVFERQLETHRSGRSERIWKNQAARHGRAVAKADREEMRALVGRLKLAGRIQVETEARIESLVTEHEDKRCAGVADDFESAFDQPGPDSLALDPGVDGHGAKPHRAELPEHANRVEQDMADDLSVLFRNQFEQDVTVLFQPPDDGGLVGLAEGASIQIEDRIAIFRLRLPHHKFCVAHASLHPLPIGEPRWKSSAVIVPFPARCNRLIRTAPDPHATRSLSSRTSPGLPSPASAVACSALMRWRPCESGSSNHAPGKGDRPRMRDATSLAGRAQSIRASAAVTLAA